MPRPPSQPLLRFTPTAWAKLLFLRDLGPTEVGGFGISDPEDLLLVQDIRLVKQTCTWAHVKFDDESVADFFEEQVDLGRRPETFGRLWLHTHPGDSPDPSEVDEETFLRCFGKSNWAVMFILARGGQSYARLRFNVGPGGEIKIPVAVDWSRPFDGSDWQRWEAEYCQNVNLEKLPPLASRNALAPDNPWWDDDWQDTCHDHDEFLDAWEQYVQSSNGETDDTQQRF